jgi:hypothetical protein
VVEPEDGGGESRDARPGGLRSLPFYKTVVEAVFAKRFSASTPLEKLLHMRSRGPTTRRLKISSGKKPEGAKARAEAVTEAPKKCVFLRFILTNLTQSIRPYLVLQHRL